MAVTAEEASRRRGLLVADAYDGQSEVVHLKISPGAASVLLAYEKQVALSAHVSYTPPSPGACRPVVQQAGPDATMGSLMDRAEAFRGSSLWLKSRGFEFLRCPAAWQDGYIPQQLLL
jgi:hypothetical protein